MFLHTRVFSKADEWFFEAGSTKERKIVKGPFKTMRGAELALAGYLRTNQFEFPRPDKRLDMLLSEIGLTCCRMAFKLSYVSGFPVQEVGEMLGLQEDEAEKAIQAGEYSLSYLKIGTAARLTRSEVEQAVGQIFS